MTAVPASVWVADDQARLNRRVHDPGQQPVGLGDGVGRDRVALQAGQPGPDHQQVQAASAVSAKAGSRNRRGR
jgi:hypothetical protein